MLNKASNKSGGYALVTGLLFFFAVSAAVMAGVSDSVMREIRASRIDSATKQSYFAAESALEDAVYRIQTARQIGSEETVFVGSATAALTVETTEEGGRNVRSIGSFGGVARTMSAILEPQEEGGFTASSWGEVE